MSLFAVGRSANPLIYLLFTRKNYTQRILLERAIEKNTKMVTCGQSCKIEPTSLVLFKTFEVLHRSSALAFHLLRMDLSGENILYYENVSKELQEV